MAEKLGLQVMGCCDSHHQFDLHKVRKKWLPRKLRCLIIGESPGGIGAKYFYDPIPRGIKDPIEVRRNLLTGLAASGLISSPTLEAFKKKGFLFDHAIRCQLPIAEIERERRLALRYASPRAENATHLQPLIQQAAKVWAMGHIARNAVAFLYPEIPWGPAQISKAPYPTRIPETNVFVSRYLNRITFDEVVQIFDRFKEFLNRTDGVTEVRP